MTIDELFQAKGFLRSNKLTKLNSFNVIGKRSLLKSQAANRDNTGWPCAEHIVVNENYDDAELPSLLNSWKSLAQGDPSDLKRQRLYVSRDGEVYDVYDAEGVRIATGALESVVARLGGVKKSLEEDFKSWLEVNGVTSDAKNYVDHLKAMGEPMSDHSPAGRWPGFYEYLTGLRPAKQVYEVSGLDEFDSNYGELRRFFYCENETPEEHFNAERYAECYEYSHRANEGDNRTLLNAYKKFRTYLSIVSKGMFLAAIRTKPFILLAGISGTGKSRLVRQLAKATCPVAVPATKKSVSEDLWKPDIPAMEASWREFLSKWPLERLKTMTLEQYTAVGKKDSFCYDLECKNAVIGSIKGNTSFKFGIYEYNPRNAPKIRGNQKKDERYAWNGKYGATREEAWNAIRAIIIDVATAAAKGEVAAVDVADFTPIVKWKIAFLYQSQSNPCVINCFSPDKVTDLTQDLADNTPMSARHAFLLSQKPDGVPLLQHGADCWNRLLDEEREEEGDNASLEFKDRCDIWNYLLVPVRPSWHDSTELLGYVTRITDDNKPQYVLTPFVKFIIKAMMNPNVPFYLCLDEMNLAPVEQYFAEYLSVIETRQRVDKDDHSKGITTDVMVRFDVAQARNSNGNATEKEFVRQTVNVLFDGLVDVSDDGTVTEIVSGAKVIYEQILTDKGLRLPPNLIVMGTVNMDETTFSFSRKVLDRAMSFELNEVDMDAGLQQRNDIEYGAILADSAKASLIQGCEAYAADQTLCDKVKSYLIAINERLEGTSFKIAYRTRDEMMIYCIERTKSGVVGLTQALDEATSMKILSRIEGDTDRITEAKLTSFRDLIVGELLKVDGKDGTAAGVAAFLGDAEKVKASACCLKLNQMIKTVHDGAGFVSFWQC